MPKLRKTIKEDLQQPSDSLIGKYTSFDDQQTAMQEPRESGNSEVQEAEGRLKRKSKSAVRKVNGRSARKGKKQVGDEVVGEEKVSKRKSRSKRKVKEEDIQRTSQNQQQPKKQQNDHPLEQSQTNSISVKILHKPPQHQQSPINFNLRRRKPQTGKLSQQNFKLILDKFNEEESSGDEDKEGGVDLGELEQLERKHKGKKAKENRLKIKNKLFGDIQIGQQEQSYEQSDQGCPDPPEPSQELILNRKLPRSSAFNLNEKVEKKATKIRNQRQFKNCDENPKYKNQLKTIASSAKDAEQVQINVTAPTLYHKTTACNALLLKTVIARQKQDPKLSTQAHTQPQPLKQSQSSSNIPRLNKNTSLPPSQLKKVEPPKNQQIKGKKRIERNTFFNFLTQQIKQKKKTQINIKQLKGQFNVTELDGLDDEFADQTLNSCSSRSNSQSSSRNVKRLSSRESQYSRKSSSVHRVSQQRSSQQHQQQNHSQSKSQDIKRNNIVSNNTQPQVTQIHQASISQSISIKTSSKFLLKNVPTPISQTKQSQLSSSIDNNTRFTQLHQEHPPKMQIQHQHQINNHSNLSKPSNSSFQVIQEQIKEDYKKSSRILDTQDEQERGQIKNNSKVQERIVQKQQKIKQTALKLASMTKRKKSNKKNHEDKFNNQTKQQDRFNDSENENSQRQKRTKKLKPKRKKQSKPSNPQSLSSYFEQQAQYSSSQSGHSDESQPQLEQDLDSNGNIRGIVAQDFNQDTNSALVRKKFRQDQLQRDHEEYERIIKNLTRHQGKSKADIKRDQELQRRMKMAAEINRQKDKSQNENCMELKTNQKLIANAGNYDMSTTYEEDPQQAQRNRRKIQDLQEGIGNDHCPSLQIEQSVTKQKQLPLFINVVLPDPLRNRINPIVNPSLRRTTSKNPTNLNPSKPRNSIFNAKGNIVQQQIQKKRKSVQNPQLELGQGPNKNKLQKTQPINLNIIEHTGNDDIEI